MSVRSSGFRPVIPRPSVRFRGSIDPGRRTNGPNGPTSELRSQSILTSRLYMTSTASTATSNTNTPGKGKRPMTTLNDDNIIDDHPITDPHQRTLYDFNRAAWSTQRELLALDPKDIAKAITVGLPVEAATEVRGRLIEFAGNLRGFADHLDGLMTEGGS